MNNIVANRIRGQMSRSHIMTIGQSEITVVDPPLSLDELRQILLIEFDLIPKIETDKIQLPANGTQQNRIVVKSEGKIKIIPTNEIQYIEANGDNVKIMSNEGSFSKNKTMSYFEEQLSANDFVRIHRSYLVNVSLVSRIDAYDKESHLAVLSNGIQLPVSKSGYQRLKEILGM